MDIKRIAELNNRLGEICKILTEATNTKKITGSSPLPYNIYEKLCNERRRIREELNSMT